MISDNYFAPTTEISTFTFKGNYETCTVSLAGKFSEKIRTINIIHLRKIIHVGEKKLIETASGKSFDDFFENYVWGTSSLEPILKKCFDYIGCELINTKSRKFHEAHWGLKTNPLLPGKAGSEVISSIFLNSVAEDAGLSVNDEIISINSFDLKNDLTEWSRYFSFKEIKLIVKKNQQIFEINLKPSTEIFYNTYFVNKLLNSSEQQKENFGKRAKGKF